MGMNYNLDFATKEEKIEFLKKNASGIEFGFEYLRNFTEDELKKYETDYVSESQKRAKLKDKLLEVSVPVKSEIKAVEQKLDVILGVINDKGLIETDNCFKVRDDLNKTMCYFNQEGDFVHSRPYTTAEMQMDIVSTQTDESDSTEIAIIN